MPRPVTYEQEARSVSCPGYPLPFYARAELGVLFKSHFMAREEAHKAWGCPTSVVTSCRQLQSA